jgi:hypothetical protein
LLLLHPLHERLLLLAEHLLHGCALLHFLPPTGKLRPPEVKGWEPSIGSMRLAKKNVGMSAQGEAPR